MTGQGSGGNVLAAIASFLIPGLGQLVQGRALRGLLMFVLTGVLWIITFGLGGWLGNLWACYDAAVWKGPKGARQHSPRLRRAGRRTVDRRQ